ncbi:MAG: RcnB family protein [Pseudomonadota bacterium]|nr:RcnB family protein [Pseudomonadota bacterium]
MQRRTLSIAALAALVGLTPLAHAQPGPGGPHEQPSRSQGQRSQPAQAPRAPQAAQPARQHQNARQDTRQDMHQPPSPRNDTPTARSGHARQGVPAAGRGAGPDHAFHRGDRLPAAYRHQHYVVNDWRAHQLSAPPRGHHWVQVGGDYVLVAIATGVITALVLAH